MLIDFSLFAYFDIFCRLLISKKLFFCGEHFRSIEAQGLGGGVLRVLRHRRLQVARLWPGSGVRKVKLATVVPMPPLLEL